MATTNKPIQTPTPPQPLDRNGYQRALQRLQIGLDKPHRHVIPGNRNVLNILGGRDAAGKGGTGKRIASPSGPAATPFNHFSGAPPAYNNDKFTLRLAMFFPLVPALALESNFLERQCQAMTTKRTRILRTEIGNCLNFSLHVELPRAQLGCLPVAVCECRQEALDLRLTA